MQSTGQTTSCLVSSVGLDIAESLTDVKPSRCWAGTDPPFQKIPAQAGVCRGGAVKHARQAWQAGSAWGESG